MQTLMVKSGKRYRKATAAEVAEVAGEFARRELSRVREPMGNPQLVVPYLQKMYLGRDYETFIVLFLDTRYRLLEPVEMFRGTLSSSSVHPREVVKECLWRGAASIICAHNHPSGVADPSRADTYITAALERALSTIDIRLLDHLIIAGAGYFSFRQAGRI